MNTDELIASLSEDTSPAKPIATPISLWSISLGASIAYTGALVALLGVRPDLQAFMMQPYSFIEIWLLFILLASSLWAAICHVYPDQYGKPLMTSLPYVIFGLLVLVLVMQLDDMDPVKLINGMPMHITCLSCIAAASILPSILLFLLTQRGASTAPIKSGILITLAAVSIGCIAVRLHESSSDMAHLLTAHYLPILIFAAAGAVFGRAILRW